MKTYVLPALDYDFSALEPHISGQIMQVHHGHHHRAYVNNANEQVEKLQEARQTQDFSSIAAIEKALAFNVSGHVLHSIFWKNLSPEGGDAPTGALAEQIVRDFGGFERFRTQLTQVASTLMGSGWAALVWEPISERLMTCQIYDHQSNVIQDGVTLAVIDAWEHAYYLQYHDQKKAFFDAIWNLWNWDDVSRRLEGARAHALTAPAAV